MDFFERQQHARRRTGLLVLVFLLAVAAIVAAVTAVAWGLLTWIDGAPAAAGRLRSPVTRRIVGATLAVIAGGSTMRWIQLALGGGDRVATMVGGRLLDPDTKHPQERVLINVVEDMAIAPGVIVPNV